MSSSFKTNFQCVAVASVELIPLPLGDILASCISPTNLYNKINSSSSLKNQLAQHQLKICFLQPPFKPDYTKFDVCLLYKLIRNLCFLPSPSQGWGNEPKSTDTQLSDDIERLRLFRNNYYGHIDSAEISDVLFDDIWMNLKRVFKRIRSQVKSSVDYEQKLLEIERYKVTQDQFYTCRLLLDAYVNLETQIYTRDEPVILVKGLDEVVCGDTVQFEADVKTAELSNWSIIWQRHREDTKDCIDTNKKKYMGSTNRILVIKSVCKDDEGEYRAVLSRDSTGQYYKSKNRIRLHVLGELPILNDLTVTTVYDGVIIQCSYELSRQSPEVHCIEWKKNGQPLDRKTSKYIGGNVDDKYLRIASTTYEDRGEYSCTVTNAVGSVSKKIMLGVPTVKLSIDSTFRFGSRAIFNAEVTAIPFPEKAKWQKSKELDNFHSINITDPKYNGSKDIPESPVLVVSNIDFEDKIHYRLLVSNKIGDGISDTVYLNVTGSRPNITTSEHTNIKERSIKLVGNVFVYDDSPDIIKVFWTKNKMKIESVYTPTLTIRDVSDKDAGRYQLTATNAIGSTTSDAIVLGKPNVFFERPMTNTDGSQRFSVTIKAIPAPCSVMWSSKTSDDDDFIPVDINACDYKGTTLSFPHPVLVVNEKEQLEKRTYQIEVANFIGKTVKQIPERKIYKKRNTGIRFVKFSNYLANNFPPEKLLDLKYMLRASGKVTDVNSLKAANTVMKCFIVLQDENLFTQNNVIFMQFLFKEMHCDELYEKCIQFAQDQEALCFFLKPPDNGYKNVKFHIQGDFNNYSEDQIEFIREEVADMLECEDGDILENGLMEASSFMLVLSIKETYMHKLFTLGEQDRLKLRKLNIDYFIIDKETIILESENGNVGENLYEEKDAGLEFAKLSYILANQFPKEKLQNLKDVLIDIFVITSGRVDAVDSIRTADSVLKCFSILQDEHLFNENVFSCMHFLCKETPCDKLCTKCEHLALATAQEEFKVLKHDQEHSIGEETDRFLQRKEVKTFRKLFEGGFENAWVDSKKEEDIEYEPCLNVNQKITATHICKTCEDPEPLCELCAKQNARQKVFRDHKLSRNMRELKKHASNKSVDSQQEEYTICEPCIYDGKKVTAIYFCKTCKDPEALCEVCAKHHTRQKAFRNHELCGSMHDFLKHHSNKRCLEKTYEAYDNQSPGKPQPTNIKSDTVSLCWKKCRESVNHYMIRYKAKTENAKWKFIVTDSDENHITITGLMANTKYIFQVRGIFEDQEGPFGPVNESVETKKSLATALLDLSIQNKTGNPLIYLLPVQENKEARNISARTRQLVLGNSSPDYQDEKTIMLVGVTGSGKSTLVDCIANYIMGVSFEDPFRFTMVTLEEEEKKTHDQAISQTEWITVYKIYPTEGSRLSYTLNIIDTPGFGDVRGIQRDNAIVDQIRQLFSAKGDQGVLCIDAVCFIVKAPEARLTVVQKYIFSSIMSLFGKDIESNICTFITFADGATPPVLASLKESKLPFGSIFNFNNSALFADNKNLIHKTLAPMFWKMGYSSFENFFEQIRKLQTRSLCQTKNVLDEREQLKTVISNILPQVTAGLSTLSELQQQLDIFKKYKNEIKDNQNFEYEVEETRQEMVDLPQGQYVTNCLQCNITCHEDCKIADDEKKRGCWAMNQDTGQCRICTGKCIWSDHKNTPFVYRYVTETVTKTYAEMKERYEQAVGQKLTHETYIEKLHYDAEDKVENIMSMMNEMNRCKTRLKEIALRPDPLSAIEHIDLMMQSEENEKQSGYLNRIKMLQEIKRIALVDKDVESFGQNINSQERTLSQSREKASKKETLETSTLPWGLPFKLE